MKNRNAEVVLFVELEFLKFRVSSRILNIIMSEIAGGDIARRQWQSYIVEISSSSPKKIINEVKSLI